MTAADADDVTADDDTAADDTAAAAAPRAATVDTPARARVRPSPPARVVRAVRRSAPATRARALGAVVLVALAVAAPLVAGADAERADTDAAALGAARAHASDLRTAGEGARDEAADRSAVAAELAVAALAAHNEQRHRLAALGLNEQTIDAFLEAQLGNTELVEYRRDRTTADVDRQAAEIPQMEQCLERAKDSVNQAFNTQFGNAAPPGPSELCRALLG